MKTEKRSREIPGGPSDGRTERRHRTREQILDGAEELVRSTGDLSFSTRELAAHAGVSPTSLFNHFGSKRGVLDGILARTLERLGSELATRESADSIEDIFQAATSVTSLYADDPTLYRPVFGELFGSPRSEPDPVLVLATKSWLRGLRAARAAGLLQRGRDLEVIASELEVHWVGTLAGWVAGSFDKATWLLRVRYGTAVILLGAAKSDVAERLRRQAVAMERQIATRLKLEQRDSRSAPQGRARRLA